MTEQEVRIKCLELAMQQLEKLEEPDEIIRESAFPALTMAQEIYEYVYHRKTKWPLSGTESKPLPEQESEPLPEQESEPRWLINVNVQKVPS